MTHTTSHTLHINLPFSFLSVSLCLLICTYIHIYIHMYIHAHTHTHTRAHVRGIVGSEDEHEHRVRVYLRTLCINLYFGSLSFSLFIDMHARVYTRTHTHTHTPKCMYKVLSAVKTSTSIVSVSIQGPYIKPHFFTFHILFSLFIDTDVHIYTYTHTHTQTHTHPSACTRCCRQ